MPYYCDHADGTAFDFAGKRLMLSIMVPEVLRKNSRGTLPIQGEVAGGDTPRPVGEL
jgi:hypothetical protein